jgi:hypothetical protein
MDIRNAFLAGLLAAVSSGPLLSGCAPSPDAAARLDRSSGSIVNRSLAERFPGAILLGEAEFASAVVGRLFRYRHLGSGIIVERPKEVFIEGGRYRIHWLRSISYGTYSVERGTVSIDCAGCRNTFLNLGRERIFFRHEGRLLTADANGDGSVVELIPEP